MNKRSPKTVVPAIAVMHGAWVLRRVLAVCCVPEEKYKMFKV